MRTFRVTLLTLIALAASSDATSAIRGRLHDSLLMRLPAVVYIERIEGKTFPPPTAHPVIDQKNLVFTPRVLPVLKGTTVDFKNSDSVKHNVFSSRKSPTVFNLGTYSAGTVMSVTFDKPGVVTLLCNVHSEMSAYVLVLETPYFAVTDREGNFAIAGVPPGTYRINFWHEILAGTPQEITVKDNEISSVDWHQLKRK